MPEKVMLPDGSYVMMPDNLSPESRAEFDRQIALKFPQSQPQVGTDMYGSDLQSLYQMYGEGSGTGVASLPQEPERKTEGTTLGSLLEGIKSIPRGVRQFGLMAQQGFEGIRTPDEDTDREKELRQRMEDLMMEIDPAYRDSNLVNVGMGLGQVAGMMGLGALATVGGGAVGLGATAAGYAAGAVAGSATALMGAGEQSSRIAEFEERTGQDVSAEKEKMALAMGLGIGLSEIAPLGKFARGLGLARKSGASLTQQVVDSAADMTKGKMMKSMMRQAVEEAAQEGTAGFAQSATARYLYDDEALNSAGAEALREALVGGQVGAVTDLTLKMLTRSIGNKRSKTGDYYLNRVLDDEQKKAIKDGTAPVESFITDLISGADVDLAAKDAELQERVNDPDDSMTNDEAVAELGRLTDIQALRDTVVTTEDGKLVRNEEEGSLHSIAQSKQEELLRGLEVDFKEGKFGKPEYDKLVEAAEIRHDQFSGEYAKLVAAYKAQADGTLAEPSQQEAEEEAANIDERVTAEDAKQAAQEEQALLGTRWTPENAEAKKAKQRELQEIQGRYEQQNTTQPNKEIEKTDIPIADIEMGQLAGAIESELGPTQEDIIDEAAVENQKDVITAGYMMAPIVEKIKSLKEQVTIWGNKVESQRKTRKAREASVEEANKVALELALVQGGTQAAQQAQTQATDVAVADVVPVKSEKDLRPELRKQYDANKDLLPELIKQEISERQAEAVMDVEATEDVAVPQQVDGIAQLEAISNIGENLSRAINKNGTVSKVLTNKTGIKTVEEVKALRSAQKQLATLKKREAKLQEELDNATPQRRLNRVKKRLEEAERERAALWGGPNAEAQIEIAEIRKDPDIDVNIDKALIEKDTKLSAAFKKKKQANGKKFTVKRVKELRIKQARLRSLEEALGSQVDADVVFSTKEDGITQLDLAKRGVEPYASNVRKARKDKLASLQNQAAKKGLKDEDYDQFVEEGMAEAAIGSKVEKVLLSGFGTLMREENQKKRQDDAVSRKMGLSHVTMDQLSGITDPEEGDAVYNLEQRLRSPEQRQAYQDFVARLAADPKQKISSVEAEQIINDILSGTEEGGVLVRSSSVGLKVDAPSATRRTSLVQSPEYVSDKQRRPREKGQRDSKGKLIRPVGPESARGREAAEGAMKALGMMSTIEISQQMDKTAHDKPAPEHWIGGLMMGKLADGRMVTLRKKLQKQGYSIKVEDLAEIFRIKNYKVPKNLTKSKILRELIADTTNEQTSWGKLKPRQQEEVFARVLKTRPRRDNTEKGRLEDNKKKKVLKEVNNGTIGDQKSTDQKVAETKNIIEAEKRISRFREAIQSRLKRLGFTGVIPMLMADVDSVFADAKDIIINGAFEVERDSDGEVVMERNKKGKLVPKLARNADGTLTYRAKYKDGSIASLEGYGTRIVFNLSQIASQYTNWEANIDKIVKDAIVHEQAHSHFLKDHINTTERKALEKFGKREGKVPASISEEAHKKRWTWQQFVKKTYPELTEANLIEETSVQILDAIAQGDIERSQTAGTIGKIKRRLAGMFGAIAESVEDADLIPVMQVFETITNVETMKERKSKRRSAKGLPSLQFVERADQDHLQQLKEAVAKGDPELINEKARQIIESRIEDSRSPLERMQESLISELRARAEIEGNPDQIVASVLNVDAIKKGEVTAESLNAYFRFVDGREPALRMPPEKMLKKMRGGKSNVVFSDQALSLIDRLKSSGIIEDGEYAAAEAVIRSRDRHNAWRDENGMERTVLSMEDYNEMMDYTGKQLRVMKYLDKRLPMWLSAKRTMKGEVKEYNSAITRLAQNSAIAAWRLADNAMKFVPMMLEHGPIKYIGGGFTKGQSYAIDPATVTRDEQGNITGGFKLDEKGAKIPVKGLQHIIRPILEMGEAGQELALGYMSSLRIVDVYDALQTATAAKDAAMATLPATDPKLTEILIEYELAKDAYERTNPTKNNKSFMPIDDARAMKKQIEEGQSEEYQRVVRFANEYADFNFHQIEFAHSVGMLSRADATRMQSLSYVPFYRGVDWQNTSPLENRKNAKVEQANRELKEGEPILRGSILLDKSIQGSFKPISKDLFANLEKNASDIVRDAMNGIATQRTMRDEIRNKTAVEIKEPTAAQYARRKFLQKELKREADANDALAVKEQQLQSAELTALENEIKTLEQDAEALHKKLDEAGFSEIVVRTKGISTEVTLEGVVDENGEPVIDPNTDKQQMKAKDTEVAEHGVPKAYRVMDPELSQSIMEIGFSPQQAIEDFFGKTVGIKSEKFNKGAAKLLVGSSRLLREMVTRSPPFALKNLIRDSLQASVIYGGGVKVMRDAWYNAIFRSDTLETAEKRGLGIAVDWQPDDYKNLDYGGSIPFLGGAWKAMGSWSQKLEVSTRLAVYDHTIANTEGVAGHDGNAAEALYQATELLNYGRRGSSRMFSVIAAMAPFMNGRVQGLNVMFRNHWGSLDAPGLFMEEGWKMDGSKEMWARRAQAFGRGSVIMLGTMLYFLMVHDEEEYKNARDDIKDDWWMIPLGHGKDGKPRPSFKLPIPFEVGLFYKVLPEQMMRMIFEQEHDFGDVKQSLKRQLKASLYFDLRPQLIRPVIDAMTNHDSFQRDEIVPSWMQNTVAASEHYNPYTNMVTRLLGDKLSKIPMLNKMEFLSSPMKLEYMIRQYVGTIGGYGMVLADRGARWATGENVVGTSADFGSFAQPISARTFANIPMIGDLFMDPAKGGGYQEDLYEIQEKLDKMITTVGQIEEGRGPQEARDFKAENPEFFRNKSRLQYLDRRMKHYRTERDMLFNRKDLSDEDKRRHLFRMFETRDDMLEDVLRIMADLRKNRSFMDEVLGADR